VLRINVKEPPKGKIASEGRRVARAEKRAIHNAVDRASKDGQKNIQATMKAVGLGRLGNAVGHTSSKRKGRTDERTAWGTVYARGGDQSLAGGALESYTRGTTIRPTTQQWLWFQTKALPRRINRYRTTPARYNASTLVNTIGPLHFVRLSANRALLVVRNVSVSPKTGRAKAMGPRKTRTRIPMKELVAFVGIRMTRRAKRVDHLQLMNRASEMVLTYYPQELEQLLSRAA
jgi:hypothetical protein